MRPQLVDNKAMNRSAVMGGIGALVAGALFILPILLKPDFTQIAEVFSEKKTEPTENTSATNPAAETTALNFESASSSSDVALKTSETDESNTEESASENETEIAFAHVVPNNTKLPEQITRTPVKELEPRVAGASTSTTPPPPEATPEPVIVPLTPQLIITPAEPIPSQLAPAGSQVLAFLNVYMTAQDGDVAVTNLTIERMGLGSDAAFSAVGALDNGNPVGIARALRADHRYNSSAGFTIKKGETRMVTIFGSMAFDLSSFHGQMPTLALSAVEADVPIQASFPIIGTPHTINATLSIGSLTTASNSAFDPGVRKYFYILTDKDVFSGFKLTGGNSEPVILKQVVWRQNGTASLDDVKNVYTVVVQKGTYKDFETPLVDPQKRAYSANFNDEIVIDRGETIEIFVRGTVGLGVDRTVVFDIDDYPDILGLGASYGYYILALGGDTNGAAAEGQFSTLLHPFYHGFQHTIQAGSMGVGR